MARGQTWTVSRLAALTPAQAEDVPLGVWTEVVEAAPPGDVAAHPRAMLHLARALEPGQRLARRTQALDRLAALGSDLDPVLIREVWAERAIDASRTAALDEAEQLARRALSGTGADEAVGRARAGEALGRVLAWRGDEMSSRAADRQLQETGAAYDELGTTDWAGHVRFWRGNAVYYQRGDLAGAETLMRDALAVLSEHSPRRGVVLTFFAELFTMRGEWDVVEAALDEAATLAAEHGDDMTRAYITWQRARMGSLRDDAPATLRALAETERNVADWFDTTTGSTYLADAAELLDRVGEHDMAADYLSRALAKDPHDEFVLQARAALLARRGDPEQALVELRALTQAPWLEVRLTWRRTMLAAYATLRAGRDGVGAIAARALDQAASLGDAGVAVVGEPAMVRALLPLAAHAGSSVAESLLAPDGGLVVRLLGEATLRRASVAVPLPSGLPAALVRLVSLHPTGVDVDEVIEAFWPDDDAEAGRRRVRGALSRLRVRAGDVIERDGSRLRVAAAWVDAWAFRDAADRALVGRNADGESLAVAALALWTGELLPGDPYESWAVGPREQLRRRRLDLLDLVARSAAQRGSLGEARQALEQAIEIDRYDETRYVQVARHWLAEGRREPARRMLDRASAILSELGLGETDELLSMRHELGLT